MKVFIQPDAEAEMESARAYLDRQSSRLGRPFLDDLKLTTSTIADRPDTFRRLQTLTPDQPNRRALLKEFSHFVVFEIVSDAVHVIAVSHTSRAPK